MIVHSNVVFAMWMIRLETVVWNLIPYPCMIKDFVVMSNCSRYDTSRHVALSMASTKPYSPPLELRTLLGYVLR